MPVTLKDIAERTGVSPSVVSTVLSGRDNGTFVSDSTRRKVLQVAEIAELYAGSRGPPARQQASAPPAYGAVYRRLGPGLQPVQRLYGPKPASCLARPCQRAGSGGRRRLRPAPADGGGLAASGCARHYGHCSAFVLAAAPRGGSGQHSLRHGRRDGQSAARI